MAIKYSTLVKSGNFGHHVNSDMHLQIVEILMRRLQMSRLIRVFNVCFVNTFLYSNDKKYVGHPISSDNGIISQKLLLKSEFYYPLHVAMGVAYSCLRYGGFFLSKPDLMLHKFVNNTVRSHGHEKSRF